MNVCGSAACTWTGGPTSSPRRLLPWSHATSSETGDGGPLAKSTAVDADSGTSGLRVQVEAERMAGRVEQHPHVVLRLVPRHLGAEVDRVGDGGAEVVHLEVEVHHHLLGAVGGRPDRALV